MKKIYPILIIIIVVALCSYLAYDNFITKNNAIKDLNKEVSSLKSEIKKLSESKNENEEGIENENQTNLIGAYKGIVTALPEIGRPTENDEILIKDDKNATYCSEMNDIVDCYEATYLEKDNTLYLLYKINNEETYKTYEITSTGLKLNHSILISTLNKIEKENLEYIN